MHLPNQLPDGVAHDRVPLAQLRQLAVPPRLQGHVAPREHLLVVRRVVVVHHLLHRGRRRCQARGRLGRLAQGLRGLLGGPLAPVGTLGLLGQRSGELVSLLLESAALRLRRLLQVPLQRLRGRRALCLQLAHQGHQLPPGHPLLLAGGLLHGRLHLLVSSAGLLGALQARDHVAVLAQGGAVPDGQGRALWELHPVQGAMAMAL